MKMTTFMALLVAITTFLSTPASANTTTPTEKPALLTEIPKIPPGVIPDEVGGNLVDLEGADFSYIYSSGRSYHLKFYDDRFTFTQLDHEAPPITLPYLARKLEDGSYFIHWMVPGRIGHVALVVNFKTKHIAAAALMPGQSELFDTGNITSINMLPK